MTEKWIALLLLAGCASQQIPEAEQGAYFRCPGIIVDTASENLQRAGYITAWREGDESIETEWISYTVEEDGEARTRYLRYVVEAANDGVRFAIFERTDDARVEAPWDRITKRQVEEPGVAALLEKIRRDVCGTADRFFTPRAPAGSTASP